MLVLTRKTAEAITIGDNMKVVVISISGNRVRLGIEAPAHCSIRRSTPPAIVNEEPLFPYESTCPR